MQHKCSNSFFKVNFNPIVFSVQAYGRSELIYKCSLAVCPARYEHIEYLVR